MSNIHLSKRLQTVADSVHSGGVVADIGCDHGFTSIYLVKKGLAKRALAMDINEGPLERARLHVKEYSLEDFIELRLSDGAKKLAVKEADTLLISGMGGALTVKILADSKDVVAEVKELVLSPQSEIFLVRHYLHDHGFTIADEQMVKDQGKYYTVIRAVPGQERYDREESYIYGDILIRKKDSVLQAFLLEEKERTSSIIKALSLKELSEDAKDRYGELTEKNAMIENILCRMEDDA